MKLLPINLENDHLLVHPLRANDIHNVENAVFEILSDIENTRFISEKRISDKKGAENRVQAFVLGYHLGISYAHFITDKKLNKIIGVIDVISPEQAKKIYKLDKYDWLIEYYLNKNYWGYGIAANIVGAVCNNLKSQGIKVIGAICDKQNVSSINVLNKVGFRKTKSFDFKQDYFLFDTTIVNTIKYPDGSIYNGELKGDKKHGKGTLKGLSGEIYVGEFKDDLFHGHGTYTFLSGEKHEGEWKNNLMDGTGTVIFASGEKYIGEFKNGEYHGSGTQTFPSGEKYVGEFKDGKKHGKGILSWPDGESYVGEFKDGKKHGIGTYTFRNGNKHVGEFKDDKPIK